MIQNLWLNIVSWFQDRNDRNRLIRNFNESAKKAYIQGSVPVYLNAKISKGDSNYRHQFSNRFYSGFRIVAFTGRHLTRNEVIQIGQVVLSDQTLVRNLVVLGWDTLEVHGENDSYGCKWQLSDILQLK
ncbi:MAG: hypothetical protein R3Y59_05270 [bacterium]